MDNRMIDVAIGLALVFAMTSLMVTALQEILSQWSGKRGAVLLRALTSFAGNDPRFVRQLLAHPLIKSLSPPDLGPATGRAAGRLLKWLPFARTGDTAPRLPSYIEADSLVSALIGQLVHTHMAGVRPQTPIELVSVVLQMAREGPAAPKLSGGAALPPAMPNLELAQGLAALTSGVEHDWPAFEARVAAWYDAVNERATGWFKRGVRLSVFFIGLATAFIVNVNPVVIGARLWEDEALRAAVVSAAQQTLQNQGADKATPPHLPASAAPAAPAQPAATRLVVQASGQQGVSPRALALSAPPPAAATAARAERAMESLANAVFTEGERKNLSSTMRARLGEVAARTIALEPQLKAALKTEDAGQRAALLGRVADANNRLLEGLGASPVLDTLKLPQQTLRDALAEAAAPAAAQVMDAVQKEPLPPQAEVKAPLRHSSCDAFSGDADVLKVCQRMADLTELQRAGLPIGWTASAWPRYGERCAQAGGACTLGEHLGHGGSWLNLLIALMGWIITALACTLGAPFWFDALSRLVKLRSSGAPPATAKGADSSGAPPGSQLARSATTSAAGVGAAGVPRGGAIDQGDEFAVKPRIAMSDALNDAERALDADDVKRVQRGMQMAEADASGWFDGATRQAIAAWQRGMAMEPVTGELTVSQIASLLTAPQPDAADDHQHLDGCDVEITDPTDDADLPSARGGVA